jgi:hypothetical protein
VLTKPRSSLSQKPRNTSSEPKVFTTSSSSIQTEEVFRGIITVQTDPELPRIATSIEIQTDEPEPDVSRSVSLLITPEHDETLASSSSIVLSLTLKEHLDSSHLTDAPPFYNFVTELEQVNNALMDRHKGITIPICGIPGGISADAGVRSDKSKSNWLLLDYEVRVYVSKRD